VRRETKAKYLALYIPVNEAAATGRRQLMERIGMSDRLPTGPDVVNASVFRLINAPKTILQATEQRHNNKRSRHEYLRHLHHRRDVWHRPGLRQAVRRGRKPGRDRRASSAPDRILRLPHGERPFRCVVDGTHAGVENVNAVLDAKRAEFTARLEFRDLPAQAVRGHPDLPRSTLSGGPRCRTE
jgi:hypothetical protein